MSERPPLEVTLDESTFLDYYYLKEELTDFCKTVGLPTSGGKLELTQRIAHYLKTGEILPQESKTRSTSPQAQTLTENSLIEENFVSSEIKRAFFKEKIGNTFSFNVPFQKWLKANAGKTYAQAIEAYYIILEEKKTADKVIDKQFEYNTYIRDFFKHNKDKSLSDAITCWKYKKSLSGHNRYEPSDLIALS